MHGIVFSELQKFVVSKHAHAGWKAVTEKAGLAHKVYLAAGQYPDSEIVSLVTAASAITGQEPSQIVEAFGEFIAPALLKMYGHLLKPTWKSLDVIEQRREPCTRWCARATRTHSHQSYARAETGRTRLSWCMIRRERCARWG
jgi:heme-NO-binding protein